MSEHDRTPDTVSFSFETTIDYVVDVVNGTVKVGEVADSFAEEWHYVALFCEGEFAGEAFAGHIYGEDKEDQELIQRANEIFDDAIANNTVDDGSSPARAAAREAIEVLTSGDLGPSTRDLLTLEGLSAKGTEWLEEDERASLVFEIVGEYLEASEAETEEFRQAIAKLHLQVFELHRGSAWDRT
jgi:hypothetical protein